MEHLHGARYAKIGFPVWTNHSAGLPSVVELHGSGGFF